MNEILDTPEITPSPDRTYSKLSFVTGVANVFLIAFVIWGPPYLPGFRFFMLLDMVIGLLFLLGLYYTASGFYRAEPSSLVKWIGLVLNFSLYLLVIFFVFSILRGTGEEF